MSDVAIEVKNLSKVYKLYSKPMNRMKESLHPFRKSYHKDFYALNDVSFKIEKGETVGIIGRNGSGKSTILKIITGVLTPSSGVVNVNGKISALLELGSGFNPEFTGLENVYFNGSIMGYSRKEMEEKLDDILAFADIGDFIYQPVKSYSSGMFVRLAFALAISVDPDILIVDEALSVGDAYFQAKCFSRIEDLKNNGTTIILVTHSTGEVLTHCSKAILINDGIKVQEGEPNDVVNAYLDLLFGKKGRKDTSPHKSGSLTEGSLSSKFDATTEDLFPSRFGYNKNEYVWGIGKVIIIDYKIQGEDGGEYPPAINSNETVIISGKAVFSESVQAPVYGLLIKTIDGVYLHGTNSIIERDDGEAFTPRKQGDVVFFQFKCKLNFASGNYLVSFGISEDNGVTPLYRRYDFVMITVRNDRHIVGLFDVRSEFSEGLVLGNECN